MSCPNCSCTKCFLVQNQNNITKKLTHDEFTYYLLKNGDLYASTNTAYLVISDIIDIEYVTEFLGHTSVLAVGKNYDEYLIYEAEYYPTGYQVKNKGGQVERDDEGKIKRHTGFDPMFDALPINCIIL